MQTAPDTALFIKVGAQGRLPGAIYAGLVAIVFFVGTDLVAKVPSFALGRLLFYLGLDFLFTWARSKRKDFLLHNQLVVLAILATIVVVGLLEGIAFGLFLAVIIFVINYSRLNPINNETTGDAHDSIVVRNPEERQYLEVEIRRIHIMILQGFFFFSTADRLLRIIRRRIEKPIRVN